MKLIIKNDDYSELEFEIKNDKKLTIRYYHYEIDSNIFELNEKQQFDILELIQKNLGL